ncbi:MAG: hypothetical protein C4520_13345 [Candidatus Abyssobacteria bacterium SURF_5]|uniref:Uncharacterized protein n=1 Tax=Abyssobacteria bacterium (strain SURF_5) TaxID=2093360 RepID=A0A3A4NDC0_ABYX5|nr:MAG: hypothetical protein C4520_13345 [Candidatus Abyssubacteria bacterium SURF_5]
MALRIPTWITQYAIKAGKIGFHEEIAVQLYYKWPNGLIDEITYHSHVREFGKIERRAHYHINLRGVSRLDTSVYEMMEFEIEHCRASSRPESGKLKLFLREGEWERVIDYSSFPTVLIEHRISLYESRFGMCLEKYQNRLRCETLPFGDLSVLMDWEYLLLELGDR